VEHELLPRGRELPVTDSNKLMYVYLCAHWHISRINSSAAKAFSTGLSRVIPISFLRMFTVVEVNELLGGTAAADGISVPDMQEHCQQRCHADRPGDPRSRTQGSSTPSGGTGQTSGATLRWLALWDSK